MGLRLLWAPLLRAAPPLLNLRASQKRLPRMHWPPTPPAPPTLAENLELAQVFPSQAFLPSQWSAKSPHSLFPGYPRPGGGSWLVSRDDGKGAGV